jgi:hypothetical protein
VASVNEPLVARTWGNGHVGTWKVLLDRGQMHGQHAITESKLGQIS